MDIDIHILPAMFQQVYPIYSAVRVIRNEGNWNPTDATVTALHVSLWAVWSQIPRSVLSLWASRFYRFKSNSVAPDVVLGGLVENITVDKYADIRGGTISRWWWTRLNWRNKAHLVHSVDILSMHIPLFASLWMTPLESRHNQWYARIRAWKSLLASSSSRQQFVQTQAAATTSFPLGNVHYIGGRIVVT